MALLWADGFDHYGTGTTGRSNMLLGVYAEVNGFSPETTLPRNGICSLEWDVAAGGGIRRVFGGIKYTVGVGFAFRLATLPTIDHTMALITFRDNNNDSQVTITVGTTGTIDVARGTTSGTHLEETSTPVVTAGAWFHIEAKWTTNSTKDATDGNVEIRINETTVIDYTGDVVATDELECSQVLLMKTLAGGGTTYYIDDLYAWDTATDANNTIADFIGDKDALTFYPDADGATSDWVRESDSPSASDFSKVNANTPDGDTTYLEAATLNDTEDLGIETVPATVVGIVAAVAVNMMRKTTAGASDVTPSLVGGSGGVGAGSAHALSETYAYFHDVVELDPDTASAWTATTLSAASIRLKRTT